MGKLFSICFFNIGNLWDFYNFAFQTRLNDEDNKVILPENKYFPGKRGFYLYWREETSVPLPLLIQKFFVLFLNAKGDTYIRIIRPVSP